jgi:hypothetical protein
MNNMVLTNKAEQLIMAGDLKGLDVNERLAYVKKICEDMGLNPYTKPFEYITLNGKLTLYARKDCTDQLRKIHKVSITRVDTEIVGDCYVVTAYAESGGRVDSDVGVVSIAGLKGDGMANALMKAQTKAKRRVTLSICGLGMLDETELETIPMKDVQPATVKLFQGSVDAYGEVITDVPIAQEVLDKKRDSAQEEMMHDERLKGELASLLEILSESKGMEELRNHFMNGKKLIKQFISADIRETWDACIDIMKDDMKAKLLKGDNNEEAR